MKSVNQMYTYITPFDTTEEVLQASKNVSYEVDFVRCPDTFHAWEMNQQELYNLVNDAIMSRTYGGQQLDDLERARGILNHALTVKLPRIQAKRNF
ncbi:hypothetical protein BH780_gp228 [Bacillus phage Eldridge]|uniref:Uncharacterized protein n=1 Tax=Bacillus phage Eldridge TaxID=1776293 RepID=A0A0Y0AUP6_9CAUD|nr:hypothetical protein BH780_gp228 [Bacillus phage Eldridge]AMB18811.1 hypothetical protein Eldridge_0231 [Bacillus phage Eldridge]